MNLDKILQSIYYAVDDINLQVGPEMQLEKKTSTILFGQSSKLDSFGLVTLIVAIEQKIEDDFGKTITLADEKAFSQKNSPFRSIESLADYIASLLMDNANG